jgi:hypothetical protein
MGLRFWIGIGVHALVLANAGGWNSLLGMNWRREQKKSEDKQEFSVIQIVNPFCCCESGFYFPGSSG